MSEPKTKAPRKLPKLADLHHDPVTAFKNDEFKMLLYYPPNDEWVKKHPLAKSKNDQGQEVPASYLPIDKIEFLLDLIFQEWRVEVLSVGVMFNSVYVTVRLHYKDVVTGEWRYHDGVGAKSIQTDKGYSAMDLAHVKDAAVMMALPSAKSYAIKDAAEHLGPLFGRDLNRRNKVTFDGKYDEPVTPQDGNYAVTPMQPVVDQHRDIIVPGAMQAAVQQPPIISNHDTPQPAATGIIQVAEM